MPSPSLTLKLSQIGSSETMVVSSVVEPPMPPTIRLPMLTSCRPMRPETGAVTRV